MALHRVRKRLLRPLRQPFPRFINRLYPPNLESILCLECGAYVSGKLVHLGFSNLESLFCSSCPAALLIDSPDFGSLKSINAAHRDFQEYNNHLLAPWATHEAQLQACSCGGEFRYLNPPRCPSCSGLLQGDLYEGRIIQKQRDGNAFLSGPIVRSGANGDP